MFHLQEVNFSCTLINTNNTYSWIVYKTILNLNEILHFVIWTMFKMHPNYMTLHDAINYMYSSVYARIGIPGNSSTLQIIGIRDKNQRTNHVTLLDKYDI